jgi:hypothetical protein
MNAESLAALLHSKPFRPFRIVTTDGTAYEIRHPEFLMPGRRDAFLGFPHQPSAQYYDKFIILSYLHVQRVESIDPAPAVG